MNVIKYLHIIKGVATMKAILIDNDQQMLDLLRAKITQLSDIQVLGTFTNPHQGLIELSKQEPDVVFLDISIQGVDWIEVAKQIKHAMPTMKNVFLATFAQHGIEAFEVQAADYILKPFEDVRIEQTIAKLVDEKEKVGTVYYPMIGCFYKMNFSCYGNKKEKLNINWRTSKAREIFAYLVHERGKLVRKDVIVHMFWPESSLKEAFSQLYSAIYQIRKSLKTINFHVKIISLENNYKLELHDQLIDVDVWEEGIDNMPLITADNVEAHKKLMYLYRGDYFEEESFIWSMNERNRLRLKWLNHMKRLVDYYISIEDYAEAILLNLYYQKISPYKDNSYFALMKLYAEYDDRHAVEEQYQLLRTMSDIEFGMEPNAEIVAWYEKWKRQR